jgi:GxxExxY protein
MKYEELTEPVVKAAIEVHRFLGPGLLESAYEQCMAHELKNNDVPFKLQHGLPVQYKEIKLDCGYRIDLFVEERLIVELKSVEKILPIHEAQILTYMKLAKVKVGLLINFNVLRLKDGIKRFIL